MSDSPRGNTAHQEPVRLIRPDDLDLAIGLPHLIRSHLEPLPLWFVGHHRFIWHVVGATKDFRRKLRLVVAGEQADALWMNQRCGNKISLNDSRRNEHVDVIARRQPFGHAEQVTQRDSWIIGDEGEHGLSDVAVDRWRFCSQVVFQELNVPLVGPVNLTGGTNAIIEAQRAGFGFTWRATPSAGTIKAIAIRVVLGQPGQIFFCLPFLPASLGSTQYKEIRGVKNSHTPSACAVVGELQRWRLIVIFESVWVVFLLVNRGQFHAVALKLDRHSHLAAGVSAAHVRSASLDSTSRVGGANAVDQESGCGRNGASLIPRFQFLVAEHGGPASSAAALRQRALLERIDVTHTGLVDQLLQQAPVPDGRTDFGHQFLWNVNGEPATLMPAVKRVAAVALPGLASWTVLPDARALAQRKRACCHRPQLLNGTEKPTSEITSLAVRGMCVSRHTYTTRCKYFLHGRSLASYPIRSGRTRGKPMFQLRTFGKDMLPAPGRHGDTPVANKGTYGLPSGKPMLPKWQNYG